jgi:hypothetical protein
VVSVYVVDLLIAGSVSEDINKFKLEMHEWFRISDLRLLTYYLGIEVPKDEAGISLCQSTYALKLLKKISMQDCNSCLTLMEARLQLTKAISKVLVNTMEYISVVGALRYLVHTIPNLAHAVSYLSRFMVEPREDHLRVVNRILMYIAGTHDHSIRYEHGKAEELLLLGYSDTDLVVDVDDSKNTSGIQFYLGKNPITWQSQNQKSVALLVFSTPVNNRVYKITHFQSQGGLMNEEHTNLSWFKPLCRGNSPTSSWLILKKIGVTKGD